MKRIFLISLLALLSCEGQALPPEMPELPQSEIPETAEVKQYEIVSLGKYQGRSIDWIVLNVDEDSALLLSKDILSSRPWDVTGANKTYDKSSIRVWLGGEFTSAAFSEDEKARFLRTDLDNSDQRGCGTPAGADTQDKVFLLSVKEYETYLKGSEYVVSAPTESALKEGAYTNEQGNAAWWLRSPGMSADSPAYLSSGGELGNRAHAATETIIGIRPAVRIYLSESTKVNVRFIWDRYNDLKDKSVPKYYGPNETAMGQIRFIGIDDHGTPSIELTDKEDGPCYVLCVFGSFDEMGSVKVGDTVTIRGDYHITTDKNGVVLKRCSLVH